MRFGSRVLSVGTIGLFALGLAACERGGRSSDEDRNGGYRNGKDQRTPEQRPRDGQAGKDMRAGNTVEMTSDHQFKPMNLEVREGETVTWKNTSREVHTVSTEPARASTREDKDWVKMPPGAKGFHSGEIQPGASWSHTFTTPGTYQYICTIHENRGMRGTVTVKSASE